MADPKTHSTAEIAAALRDLLVQKLAKHESDLAALCAREQKLTKHELCPLCGGPDRNGVCACLTDLHKNAVMGYGGGGKDMPAGSGAGPQSGGTQPMGMAEKGMKKGSNGEGDGGAIGMQMGEKKVAKADMCKDCGYEHMEGEHKLKKDNAGLSDVSNLSKKAPPGEEKLVHKLKDEYGHDEEGKRKAFATAWAVKNGTVNHKKSELEKSGTTPHLDEVKPGLAKGMPSSSASALAPKPPGPATSVGQANHEMGGFKSISGAHPAVAPAGGTPKVMGFPGARKPLHAMGRPTAAVSGEIPNAKAEMNPGSARSPYGTGGTGHASQTNMPSALKANTAPVAKSDDKTIPMTGSAEERAKAGTKMPKKGKKAGEGDGSGDIEKGKELRKDVNYMAKWKGGKADEAPKVSGKQPVGQGGGDAHKVAPGASGKSPLPMPTVGASPFANAKPVAKPVAGAPAGAAKGQLGKPVGPLAQRMAGAKPQGNSDALRAAAGVHGPAGQGRAPLPSTDIDVSEFAEKPKDALAQTREKMNLAADKKAGGVGFLHSLLSKFSRKPAALHEGFSNGDRVPINTAPVRSQRFHGARPLQRSEQPLFKSLGSCVLCGKGEHSGACK